MAELADALDSGSSSSDTVWVQVPLSAPNKEPRHAFSRVEVIFIICALCPKLVMNSCTILTVEIGATKYFVNSISLL